MKYTFSLCFIFFLVVLSCKDGTETNNRSKPQADKPRLEVPSDSFLVNQVKTNLEGLTAEDMYGATLPLDLSSPYMVDAERAIQGAFMVYEMEFRLHDVQIEHKSDTACIAIVEHDSRNHNERTYSPVRSKQRYTWKPVDGEWKIHKMQVLGSSPINY